MGALLVVAAFTFALAFMLSLFQDIGIMPGELPAAAQDLQCIPLQQKQRSDNGETLTAAEKECAASGTLQVPQQLAADPLGINLVLDTFAGATIALPAMLQSFGLPIELVALFTGVVWIIYSSEIISIILRWKL